MIGPLSMRKMVMSLGRGGNPLVGTDLEGWEIFREKVQAIGRLFRTTNRYGTLYVGMSEEDVRRIGQIHRLKDTPLWNPAVRKLLREVERRRTAKASDTEEEAWERLVQLRSIRVNQVIHRVAEGVYQYGNEKDIQTYKVWEEVLTYGPVVSEGEYETLPDKLRRLYERFPVLAAEKGYFFIRGGGEDYDRDVFVRLGEEACKEAAGKLSKSHISHIGPDTHDIEAILKMPVLGKKLLEKGLRPWMKEPEGEWCWMLVPPAFTNLYLGRFGELLFDCLCGDAGCWEPITEPGKLEKADRISKNGKVALDVKFYRKPFDKETGVNWKMDTLKKLAEEKVDVLGTVQVWFVNLRPTDQRYPFADGMGEFHEDRTKKGRSFRFAEWNLLYRDEGGNVAIDLDVLGKLRDKEVLG